MVTLSYIKENTKGNNNNTHLTRVNNILKKGIYITSHINAIFPFLFHFEVFEFLSGFVSWFVKWSLVGHYENFAAYNCYCMNVDSQNLFNLMKVIVLFCVLSEA